MARKREGGRLFQKRGRWYGDLRDYADVLGQDEPTRPAMVPENATGATTDHDVATVLLAERLRELEERRRRRAFGGPVRLRALGEYAKQYLKRRERDGETDPRWMIQIRKHLDAARDYFGEERPLVDITPANVRRYIAYLSRLPNGRGGTLSKGSVRHYLNSLSGLFTAAFEDGAMPMDRAHPVQRLQNKPTAPKREARWMEVPDVALLLEAARTAKLAKDKHPIPFMYPLLATYALTGGRKSEVLGLAVEDVSFDRGTVTFRPHAWRTLKTDTSRRVVPLWPQLRAILQEYLYGGDVPRVSGLLFPSPRTGEMIHDFDKSLDAIADRAGWAAGEVRSKMLRHSYCAARLQTLDAGAPVAKYTVAREMGHGGTSLVDRVYGHLGNVRHRSEVVAFRVQDHKHVLGDRLTALRDA